MNVNALAEKLRVRVRRVRLSRMFPIVVQNPRFFYIFISCSFFYLVFYPIPMNGHPKQ